MIKNVKPWLRFVTIDPVNLSPKDKLLSVLSCFSAIFLVAWITQAFNLNTAYPIIVASMGASAVILFIIPNSPLAQPWPLVGGQLVSAVAGVWSALAFADTAVASAFAVGGSVLAMLLLRCLHPPGSATALTPIMAGDPITSLGYGFVLMPVAVNVVVILLMAIIINRWIMGYSYPVLVPQSAHKKNKRDKIQAVQRTGIAEPDLEHALESMDIFIDVSASDLSKLFTDVTH